MLKHWVDASHNSEHSARLSTKPGEFSKRPAVAGLHVWPNTVRVLDVAVVVVVVVAVVVVVVVVVVVETALSNIPNETAFHILLVFLHAVLK